MLTGRDWGFGAWANCCGPGVFAFGRPLGAKRRVVRKGDLKYVILGLLRGQPMHGYEIIRRLEEESGGMYSPSPGSVYPTLQMLEDQGFVVSEQADGKKTYRITEEGLAFLDKHTARHDDIFDRFVNLGERFTGQEMRDLTRSFIRLAQVSFDRAVGESEDEGRIDALKEILDRAAREIEKAWPKSAEPAASEG
jgi:DNA-binding PadR family transcriptional regulator